MCYGKSIIKVNYDISLSPLVCFAHRCVGFGVFEPGPPFSPLLLLLALLPKTEERWLLALPYPLPAAQRWLLLHRLVRHYRHARLQVRIYMIKACVVYLWNVLVCPFRAHSGTSGQHLVCVFTPDIKRCIQMCLECTDLPFPFDM